LFCHYRQHKDEDDTSLEKWILAAIRWTIFPIAPGVAVM